ncbi:MAG: diaminopimelate decarboxylase [Chthoniobacterales bacterium]|nr:diaminopimelate decarboxylase [Chthoniobacterales bacterium]
MHAFHYRNGRLHCEEADLVQVAETHGTPLYVYSARTVRDHYRRLDQALGDLDHLICYAVKANSNRAILRLLVEQGAGFDIVSGGELYRVIAAGGDPARCTFAGVGKSREEIEYALAEGVFCFNVESEAELDYINRIAAAKGVRAPIALRVNPDVEAGAHKYVSTGRSENKFGIALDRVAAVYEAAARMSGIRIRGVQMHIGSQITDAQPFADAIAKVAPLVRAFRERYAIEFLSIGGGMGIVYESSFESGRRDWWEPSTSGEAPHALTIDEYAAATLPALRALGVRILLEPGRLLVGNAGILLTRVRYLKQAEQKKFVIVDAGMNDLIRPALYQSYHEIVPVIEPAGSNRERVDVVGPVCESGDFFAQDRELTELHEGELAAIMSAGAYGFVMASNYNSRPLPAEVLVDGARVGLVRERQTYADLVRGEHDF